MRLPDDLPMIADLRERTTWAAVERDYDPTQPPPRRDLLDRVMVGLFGTAFGLRDRLSILLTGRDRLDPRPSALHGQLEREWAAFRGAYRDGDEVWTFCNDRFDVLAGRAGYALVRDGVFVAAVTTVVN